jgi:hypothetical protein
VLPAVASGVRVRVAATGAVAGFRRPSSGRILVVPFAPSDPVWPAFVAAAGLLTPGEGHGRRAGPLPAACSSVGASSSRPSTSGTATGWAARNV